MNLAIRPPLASAAVRRAALGPDASGPFRKSCERIGEASRIEARLVQRSRNAGPPLRRVSVPRSLGGPAAGGGRYRACAAGRLLDAAREGREDECCDVSRR